MTPRRIILSTGPVNAPDALVLDHYHNCFWVNGDRRPNFHGSKPGRPGTAFRIISAILVRYPHIVPFDEMMDHVWGDDPDGGPDTARNYIAVVMARDATKELTLWMGGHVLNVPWQGFYWQWGPRTTPIRGGGRSWLNRPRKRVLTSNADTSPRGP